MTDRNTSIGDATGVSIEDLDLLLGDLDVADGDVSEPVTDAGIDAQPEASEPTIEEPVEETPVEEMIQVQETEEAANVVSGEATEVTEEQSVTDTSEGASAVEIDDALADSIAASIEVEEQRDAIYADAPADATDLEAPAPKAPTKRASSTSSTPRTPRTDVASLAADNFVLTTSIPEDLEANKTAVLASCPAQKKVKEKFDNLLTSIAAGRKPSTYTVICFSALDAAKDGEITSTELVGALKATGLGEGTARSQSGQLMALFPALKIATRAGNKLTLNKDSMLADALRAILGLGSAAPAAPAEADADLEEIEAEMRAAEDEPAPAVA